MRILFLFMLSFSLIRFGGAQALLSSFEYEPSAEHPFGQLNPKAPKELADYAPLIGNNNCKSLTRDNQGEWRKDSVDVIWRFKYIMDGLAVQDETLKADGAHTTSIRQYDIGAGKWYVTFFSSASPSLSPGTWDGGKKGNEIILYNEQKAPNGTDGFYKITFHDITDKGFNWKGEWVSTDEKFVYPVWYLFCTR
ncbi:MAG: hypothetical protein RIA63_11045 [Cyclobacteriaceae bacterium]